MPRAPKNQAPSTNASSNPVIKTKEQFDTTSVKIGQDKPRDLTVDGDAFLDPPQIEAVKEAAAKREFLDELAFMDEDVKVLVHPTADKNPEPIILLAVHGRSQNFIRGQEIVVKRKYVEALARAKLTVYEQQNYMDDQGVRAIRNLPRTALRYPFSVIHDTNPRGRAWLDKVLAEA